jgi:hypothetical protein
MSVQKIRRKSGLRGQGDKRDNVPPKAPKGDVSKPQLSVAGEGLF